MKTNYLYRLETVVAVVTSLAISTSAQALGISVNFRGGANQSGSDGRSTIDNVPAGAPGFRLMNWNNIWGSENGDPDVGGAGDSPTNLFDSTQAPTTADLTWDVDNTWRVFSFPQNDTERMRRGYIDTNVTQVIVTIDEIPYHSYLVVAYVSSDIAGRLGRIDFDSGSSIFFRSENANDGSGMFDPLHQAFATASSDATSSSYAVSEIFSNQSSFTLNVTDFGGNVGLAGFQIIQVPEPSTFTLAVLALSSLRVVRRKRSRWISPRVMARRKFNC